jgi:hypothetical protein
MFLTKSLELKALPINAEDFVGIGYRGGDPMEMSIDKTTDCYYEKQVRDYDKL